MRVTYKYIYITYAYITVGWRKRRVYCEKVSLLTIYLGGRSPGCSSPRSAAIERISY